MTNTLSVRACAKVNLALSVGPPNPPGSSHAGMHPICSWFSAIELADELTLDRLPQGSASEYRLQWMTGEPVDWHPDHDLAVRAHRALEAMVDRPLPVRLSLVKHIPAGAGLGGGSADAGAMLLALQALFHLDVEHDELAFLSRTVGSDVPFFIDHHKPPRPALVMGLGERIERLPRLDQSITLVMPPFPCPTAAVYRAYDDSPARLDEPRVRALVNARRIAPASLFNDLAEPACRIEPRLGELRARLASALREPVHVSGSGSTLFILGDHVSAIDRLDIHARVIRTRLV